MIFILKIRCKVSENDEVNKRIGVSVVKDNASGDLIIKLVNVLPVVVNPSIELSNFSLLENADYTLLTATPENTTARPVTQKIAIKEAFSKELPPYSFVVIRAKTK